MITTENINGEKVIINWSFVEKVEDLDGAQWAAWQVDGETDDGRVFVGSCQASGSCPDDIYDDVTDIEEIITEEA